jgi:hypothetical protein
MINLGNCWQTAGRVPRSTFDVAPWSPQKKPPLVSWGGQNFGRTQVNDFRDTKSRLGPSAPQLQRGDLRSMRAIGEGDVCGVLNHACVCPIPITHLPKPGGIVLDSSKSGCFSLLSIYSLSELVISARFLRPTRGFITVPAVLSKSIAEEFPVTGISAMENQTPRCQRPLCGAFTLLP